MPRECVVNCDHIQTVSKNKLGALIAVLTPIKMAEVGDAISFALGLA
jgi:mRNA interferase MazF